MSPLRWIRSRLTVRLTLTMLLVSLGPLLAAGFIVLRLIEDSVRAEIRAQHDQLATVSATNVYHYVERAVSKLRYVSTIIPQQQEAEPQPPPANPPRAEPPVQEPPQKRQDGDQLAQAEQQAPTRRQYEQLSGQDLQNRLSQVLDPSREFGDLNYRNQGGKNRNDTRAQQRALNPKQQESVTKWSQSNVMDAPEGQSKIVKEAFAGNDYVAPKVEKGDDIVFLPIAIPLREGDDVFGMLSATLDFGPVGDMLRDLGKDGRAIALIDGSGEVVVESAPRPEGELIETARPVGRHGWRVVVTEPADAALAPLARVRAQAIAFIGGSGAAAFALSLLLAAWILRPVRRLTSAADAMKDGALDTRSGIVRDDEIGRLAQSFDRMAASLQELDRLKSEFVAHVSHELRTPLTAMQLSVANLQDGVAGPLGARQQEVLRRVSGDIERLIRLVSEVLDIARVEAGKLELVRGPVDLAEVAREAMALLEPLAQGKGVKVQTAAEPCTIQGDRAKLHQVVTNLVGNAIKFTPSGGRVRVEVTQGVLRVTDTGPGIPPDQLPRIFDRFAQAGAINAGAGLGLSIAKKIVELHGGTISVESAVGKGTTFTVCLAFSS